LLRLFVGGGLNVLVDRSPPHDYVDGVTKGARPRPIKYWEWLPLISLYGAARSTRVPFPNLWIRYPLVELTTAALFALAWQRVADPTWLLVVILALISVLVALAFIDFETTYLPDLLVLPALGVGLLASFFIPDREWWQGLVAAAAGYAIFIHSHGSVIV